MVAVSRGFASNPAPSQLESTRAAKIARHKLFKNYSKQCSLETPFYLSIRCHCIRLVSMGIGLPLGCESDIHNIWGFSSILFEPYHTYHTYAYCRSNASVCTKIQSYSLQMPRPQLQHLCVPSSKFEPALTNRI